MLAHEFAESQRLGAAAREQLVPDAEEAEDLQDQREEPQVCDVATLGEELVQAHAIVFQTVGRCWTLKDISDGLIATPSSAKSWQRFGYVTLLKTMNPVSMGMNRPPSQTVTVLV